MLPALPAPLRAPDNLGHWRLVNRPLFLLSQLIQKRMTCGPFRCGLWPYGYVFPNPHPTALGENLAANPHRHSQSRSTPVLLTPLAARSKPTPPPPFSVLLAPPVPLPHPLWFLPPLSLSPVLNPSMDRSTQELARQRQCEPNGHGHAGQAAPRPGERRCGSPHCSWPAASRP